MGYKKEMYHKFSLNEAKELTAPKCQGSSHQGIRGKEHENLLMKT